MRRPLLLAAVLLLAGCGEVAPEPFTAARAAEPQRLELDWRETYPAAKPQLVFVVERLEVTADAWSARIAVTNATETRFAAGGRPDELSYGLMLFASEDLGELQAAADAGTLPPVRRARTIEPPPPDELAPGETWRATIAAPGSLADGSWVRVVFGPLRAQGDPPAGIEPVVVWITDLTAQL